MAEETTNYLKVLIVFASTLGILILLIGLSAVRYESVYWLASGILIASLIIVTRIRLNWWKILLGIVLILIFSVLFSVRYSRGPGIGHRSNVTIKSYVATIEPSGAENGKFKLEEKLVVEVKRPDTEAPESEVQTESIALHSRVLRSTGRGFLLREVIYSPITESADRRARLKLSSGEEVEVSVCSIKCPEVEIRLLNMPKSSFSEARFSSDIKLLPYVDTETVIWSTNLFRKDVAFTFISSPYYHLRSVFTPFLGLSTYSGWIMTLLGMVILFINKNMILHVLTSDANDTASSWWGRLKSWFKKKPKKQKPGFRPPNHDEDQQ